jgi:hypothetical protein
MIAVSELTLAEDTSRRSSKFHASTGNVKKLK